MTRRRLSGAEKAYATAVILIGAVAGLRLFSVADASRWDFRAISLFGILGILSTVVSVSYQGFKPTITVHQIGSTFAYALFLLVDPSAVCLVFAAMVAADWILNRRRPFVALFNVGQLWLALGVADAVRHAIQPGFSGVRGGDLGSLATAAVSLLAFFVVNHGLTHGIICVASRAPFLRMDAGVRVGILNEFLCVVSGLGTAVLWSVSPVLSVLGIIPIWILIGLVSLLNRGEQALETQRAELKSLQELGLEIGSELDVERLRKAVVRIATEALHASGALLAVFDPARKELMIVGHHEVRADAPSVLIPSEATTACFSDGAIWRAADYATLRDRHPEFCFLGASGLLGAPLQIQGKREGLLVIFHREGRRPFDGADVRRLETLVRFVEMALSNAQLVASIKDMQLQLLHTEKMSALGMLVSGVAHEVNNPLTSVLGYAQLLERQETDPSRLRMLEKIALSASRAGKIVQNLLTFSRKRTTEKRPTDVNEVLDLVLDLQSYSLRVGDIEVVRRLSPGLPPVSADPDQLQQVFLNLLTNAQQALSETGRKGRIVVETRSMAGTVQVVVGDNGCGIRPEDLGKIYLPFFTTKGLGKGTGLGLSICYGIVQDHGGLIHVDSRVGEGTTFTVELPVVERAPELVGAPCSDEVETAGSSVAGRVLVVDDEQAISELVRDVLEPLGWTVDLAHDGSEALGKVAERDFDVLLVDLRMPGMDGQTFYRELRASRPEVTKRVVFATGDTGGEAASRFLDETGNLVLCKPYDLQALVKAVSRVASTKPPSTR